jgi:poly(3-hydroxyalkanoate) depolymerase
LDGLRYPKEVRLIDALPRHVVAKVAKRECVSASSVSRSGADSSPPPRGTARSGIRGTRDQARISAREAGDHRIRFVDVDGIRVRAAIRGEGRPLLLVMGIGGNIEMWDPLERALDGSGIQTITFDAPGVGESTNWLRPRRMSALARTVDRLVGALGYEAVDVLGVSFGGALAQQLVRQSPDRVRRLVLAATAPGMPGIGGVPGRPSAMLTLATPLRYYSLAYFRRVAPTLYGGRIRREPELLAEQAYARMTRPPSPRGYLAQLYAMAGWTNLPWLRFIDHPTLVMAGDDDPIIPLVNARILARLIPLARLEVITGGGHLFLLEEPERSAALVREFLAQRDGT